MSSELLEDTTRPKISDLYECTDLNVCACRPLVQQLLYHLKRAAAVVVWHVARALVDPPAITDEVEHGLARDSLQPNDSHARLRMSGTPPAITTGVARPEPRHGSRHGIHARPIAALTNLSNQRYAVSGKAHRLRIASGLCKGRGISMPGCAGLCHFLATSRATDPFPCQTCSHLSRT